MVSSCHVFCTVQRYTLYRRHIQSLSQINLRHLRAILGIRWLDRVTNSEVLQRADMPSIEAMLLSRQLTWTGHVVRTNDDRLPKTTWTAQSDNSTPPISTRGTGRRWCTMAVHGVRWQFMAYDGSAWRTAVKKKSHKSRNQKSNRCRNETTTPPWTCARACKSNRSTARVRMPIPQKEIGGSFWLTIP